MCYEDAFAYAGNYYAKDYSVTTTICPITGENHLLLLRAQITAISRHGKIIQIYDCQRLRLCGRPTLQHDSHLVDQIAVCIGNPGLQALRRRGSGGAEEQFLRRRDSF